MMKIGTYNLHFGGKGRVHWNELLAEHALDVLLVQESYPPIEHLPESLHGDKHQNAVWSPAISKGAAMKWGSGVYIASGGIKSIELPDFQGWVVGIEVEELRGPSGEVKPTRIFSLHAPSGVGAYQKAVNAILDMLLEHRDGCDVIIGGDFNLTVSKRLESDNQVTKPGDLRIQDRLHREFGLSNCWRSANPDKSLAQTLRWFSNPKIPYHCDGLFVPESWALHLSSCEVLSGGKWDTMSDHNPVVAEFGGVNE